MRRIGLSSAQPAPSFRVPPGTFRVLCHQFRRDPPVLFVSPSVVRGHSRTRPQPTTPSSSYVKQTILSASARFARLDCVSRSAAERGLRKPHCRAGTRPPPAHGAGRDRLVLAGGRAPVKSQQALTWPANPLSAGVSIPPPDRKFFEKNAARAQAAAKRPRLSAPFRPQCLHKC